MNRIITVTGDFGELNVPESDILRYSGCHNSSDPRILSLCRECLDELSHSANLKAVYTQLPINFCENSADLGFCKAESASLRKFLGGSCNAFVFAATVGLGTDRLINRYSTLLPSKAVIMDGCATALIECWCDYLCKEIFGTSPLERFSPGYGDLPLEIQPCILSFLDTPVNIGLSMTESMLLTPTKSVTAIVKKKD